MRILLVEDDPPLGSSLQTGLQQAGGMTVDWLTDGKAAQRAMSTESFDVVILDIGLPGKSGLDVLRAARREGDNTPVLILTARDSVDDRVKGLDAGADDYLTKPFDLDELCARVRALKRRSHQQAKSVLLFENITLDPSTHIVTQNGNVISLPRREFALLRKFMENHDQVLSRDQLTQSLYGWGVDIDSNTLEVHIHNLRKKLGANYIRTIRGVGYMLTKIDK